jgi:pyridoxamine 5'-phosphate oxidase
MPATDSVSSGVSTRHPHPVPAFWRGDPPASPLEVPEGGLPDALPADPMPLFGAWFDQAMAAAAVPNPNAMTLATVSPEGRPAARIVLCKAFADDASVDFYTNRRSRKGLDLAAHPVASLLFHWDHAGRQARFDGPVSLVPDEESDAYFVSRPWPRRLGAWASDQSEPIESRAALEDKVRALMQRFGLDPDNPPAPDADVEIPRPEHWGGYRLLAERVELWAAQGARLHDRAEWRRTVVPAITAWRSQRLQP